jgi:hypothetical protein
MDTHPYTSHDIARLRCEERLLRAQEARRAREVPRAAKPEVARPVPRRLTLALAVRRLLTLSTVLGALAGVAVLLASAPIAQAHNTRPSWTAAKAETLVAYDATVPPLSAAERASLLPELNLTVRLLAALRLAAGDLEDGEVWDLEDEEVWLTFHRLLERYVRARNQIRDGVAIEAAACQGSGNAMPGKRFKHFRCAVTSAVLEIPQAEVQFGDEELPTVIERSPRIIGPLEAQLDVHVIGKTSIAYRQVG